MFQLRLPDLWPSLSRGHADRRDEPRQVSACLLHPITFSFLYRIYRVTQMECENLMVWGSTTEMGRELVWAGGIYMILLQCFHTWAFTAESNHDVIFSFSSVSLSPYLWNCGGRSLSQSGCKVRGSYKIVESLRRGERNQSSKDMIST